MELAGAGHFEPDQAEYDQGRSGILAELGYRVLRFSNEQALHETEQVLQAIKAQL
ncbi:endonuclease domain-containing protein [Hymenobacter chitinivorans]|uniref:endonuclease domain-containing protein n=1 Tax=Hymenobacter chitinivorans TaxID=89969 RepID=UPI000C2341F0|nr:DUF559 domain-containing protein [Hymenobacter chitinivorans]